MKHTCHWPGCGKSVSPEMWGCRAHWFALPDFIRSAIYRHYRAGQEITKDPSREYLEVARVAQLWCEAKQARINDVPGGRGLTPFELVKITDKFRLHLRNEGL